MSDLLYSGHGMELRLETAGLPDGRSKTTARLHTCDTAHILAFPEPGTVLVLREYRPFYAKYVWMLPSGKVDKETDVQAAAQRELQEETGFRARTLRHYFEVRHTERVDYRCHVFLAEDLVRDPLPQDAEEMIEVHTLSLDEAVERLLHSDPIHSISALAMLRYLRERPIV